MKDSTFEKYKLVVDELFNNKFNQRKAYQSVYVDASDEVADVECSKILRNPKVAEYKQEKQKEAQDALRVTQEGLLKELRNWAYSDITETISLSESEVKTLPESIRRLITKYKATKKTIGQGQGAIIETTIELWFVSKEKALDMIAKHIGFYEKDNSQKASQIDLSKLSPEALSELLNAGK